MVAILIDGNNIGISVHSLTGNPNTMPDFNTLIPYLLGTRKLHTLNYYREGKHISTKLTKSLREQYNGYTIPCHKNVDVHLSIDAVAIAKQITTLILLSGDGDFIPLINYLKYHGVQTEIVAVEQATSPDLIKAAAQYTPITTQHTFGGI